MFKTELSLREELARIVLGNLTLSPHFVIGTESQWNWSCIHSYLGRDSEARFGQDFEVVVLWRC